MELKNSIDDKIVCFRGNYVYSKFSLKFKKKSENSLMIIKCMNIKKFLERNVVKFGFHADITYSCVQRSCHK